MFVGLPVSVHPSGAFDVVTDTWLKSIVVFYLIVGGALWFSDARKILIAVAFAAAAINAFAFRYGYQHAGRLAVGGGTLSNPNDLAIYLVTGIPFCAYALLRAKSRVRKLFWLAMALIGLYYLSKTGSRGAVVAFGVGILYLFWKSTVRQKALMVAAATAILVLAPLVVPPRVYVRYLAMFTDNVEMSKKEAEIAESSTQMRLELLRKSIQVTRDNPVLGVGPGQFRIAAQVSHVSHNMYTQLSSETGIPGFLMYMAAVALAARSTGKVMRRTKRVPSLADVYQGALTIRIALIIYMAASFFGSVAYGVPVMILLGAAEALGKTAEREINARIAASAAAPPLNPVAPRRFALA
jgi:O-antigen ligase